MLGSLEVVPGDAVISDMCVVVFWFGVGWVFFFLLVFFLQTLQRKYLHPVRELVISDTEQLLHGRVTTDAVHTLFFFFFNTSPPPPK